MRAPIVLLAVTAVWGLTFVQTKDAVERYPLFAFLAVRFAIAVAVLGPAGVSKLHALGRRGLVAASLTGLLLAGGYALQTAGLERTTASDAGFVTGMYVVLTPLLGLAIYRTKVGGRGWAGVVLALLGLGLLSGVHAGSPVGDLLVLGSALVYALQIVLMERYAPLYNAVAFTLAELGAACAALLAVALGTGQLGFPHGWVVWSALLVTGIFASALAFLAQAWAQRRTSATRTALLFSLEPVWATLFGVTIAGDRLGVAGWGGCAAIMAGIAVAEPAAASVLARLVGRARPA